MTHEVGHWLGLFHTWGSGTGCNENNGDGIFDTPNQFTSSSQFGCNSSGFPAIGDQCTPSSQGGIMYMNYMDYSADACLILFSNGQQTAMEEVLNSGARSNFGTMDLEEIKCTPITDPPIASFTYAPDPVELCTVNGNIQFTDTSEDNPTQWTWTFSVLNGDIAIDILASSNRNPVIEVISGTSGTIEVELEVSNSLGDDTATQSISVTVSEEFCPSCEGGVSAGEDVTVCPNEETILSASTGVIGIGGETSTATIGSTTLTGNVQECISASSQASIDVTTFTFDVNPMNTTLTDIGPGSIKELCLNMTVTNNNGTYISLDHANGSYEDLWIGTGLVGGTNGNGGSTIDVCFTAGTSSGPFDGIFDGDSGGGSFVGQPTTGGWVLYVLDFGCLFENTVSPTINSASLVINDGDGGFQCEFLRWEVSGFELGTNPELPVSSASGGTITYTAVADCEGFICTDEVSVTTLPNVASGLSTIGGTAENPFGICGDEELFEMTSAGPYAYDVNTQTVAWGIWVIEDPFQQTSINPDVLPGIPPSDDDTTNDTNFLGFYGTTTMGATGEGTANLPLIGAGGTYYLAPMIVNTDNTFIEECAGISTQGTYVKQYLELSADISTNSCSDDAVTTTISFNGGLPFDDFLDNEPNHTEIYTVSVYSDADPVTDLVPDGQGTMLWDAASLELIDLPLGGYTVMIEDGIGCVVMQAFSISPDCQSDQFNQIGDINGPPSQSFPNLGNQFIEAADDFLVLGEPIRIDAVKVTGSFNQIGATANSVRVKISSDFFGNPAPTPTIDQIITPDDPTDPNFSLQFSNTVILPQGNYWISVIPSMSSADNGQWFWNATPEQTGAMAIFQDPNDLLGQTFAGWVPVNGNVGNSAAVDLSFALLEDATAGTPNDLENNVLCCDESIQLGNSGAKYDCTSFRLAWALAATNDAAGIQGAVEADYVWFGDDNDGYELTFNCVDGLPAGGYYAIPFLANKYEDSPMLIDECSIFSDGLVIGLAAPIESENVAAICTLGDGIFDLVISNLQGGANNGGNPIVEGAEYVFEDASGTLTAIYDTEAGTHTISGVSISDFNGYNLTISNSVNGQTDNCAVTLSGIDEPNCCDPAAGLPQAPMESTVCGDGSGEWVFGAAAGFDENPSDESVGTPDYAYLVANGLASIVRYVSVDGSFTATEAGEYCVFGIAYNASELQLDEVNLEDYLGDSRLSVKNALEDAGYCFEMNENAAYCVEAASAIEGVLVNIDCAPSGGMGVLTVDLSGASGGSGALSIAADSPDKDGDEISDFPYSYTVIVTDEAGCEVTLTSSVNCDVACTPDAGVLGAPSVTEACVGENGATFGAAEVVVVPSGFGAESYAYIVVNSDNEIVGVSVDGSFTASNGGEYCVYGLSYDESGGVNPPTFIGQSLTALNAALGNASVCFDLTDAAYCVEAYGAIEDVSVFADCELGGLSGTLQIDFTGASGGSGSGYAVAANSPNQIGDEINSSPFSYTVIVVDGFGCETILTGEAGCVACPSFTSISENRDACSGEGVTLTIGVSNPFDQLDRIEWTTPSGGVVGSGTSINVSETIQGCSNEAVVYTATLICNDGYTVSEEVTVTYYPEVTASASVSSDGCSISVVPACSQFVIEGYNAGQTAVVSTDIDGDNSAVTFNISNPDAPTACSAATITENYACVLPECPTISSIVELGKSAVDFSLCSADELQLEATINDPNGQLDRVEWTSASLANPIVGNQILISETIGGCDTQTFTYTLTTYCADGSTQTETINVIVYPLPDADVEILDSGCRLVVTPTCSDFSIDGSPAGESVTRNALPGNQSAQTFDVVNTTAANAGVDCGSMEVTANFNCVACSVGTGTMPSEEQWICEGEMTAIQTSGESLGMGDVLTYILHDSPSTTIGTILAQDAMGRFDANDAGMTLIRYYVSAIAGPDGDNNGTPDLEDPCTTVAPGTPVRFLNPIAYTVTYVASATVNRVDATFTITGGASELDGSNYSVSLSTGEAVNNVVHNTPFTIEALPNQEVITLNVNDAIGCSNSFEFTDIEGNELASSFLLKPIPAKDFLQLSFQALTAAQAKVSLYSVRGQLLLEERKRGEVGLNLIELNLQSLPTGMYFLSLEYDGVAVNRKVVKE